MPQHGLVLDIKGGTVHPSDNPTYKLTLDTRRTETCNPLIVDEDLLQALPSKNTSHCHFDCPNNTHPALCAIYKELFSSQLGRTTVHIIDKGNSQPVKVPHRSILFYLVDQVQCQLKDMVQEGVFEPMVCPSSSCTQVKLRAPHLC